MGDRLSWRPDAQAPLVRVGGRKLPADFAGDVVVSDVDKTYLRTNFSSLRGLLGVPFEWAVDKRHIPGARALLQELRRGVARISQIRPLYFVTASPPQLRAVLESKMTDDGVHHDGITFKDQLRVALTPWRLFQQITFKLTALLLYRLELPENARWWLLGDDAEQDARIYSIFAEICAGLHGQRLTATLRDAGVSRRDASVICKLAEPLRRHACVEGIYIHLTKGRSARSVEAAGPAVRACRDHLQTALHLAQRGKLRRAGVLRVAREIAAARPVWSPSASLVDARERFAIEDPWEELNELDR